MNTLEKQGQESQPLGLAAGAESQVGFVRPVVGLTVLNLHTLVLSL